MQPTCLRCGRPLAGSGMSAPGATPQPSCACGDAVALHASAAGGGGKRSREVDPLDAPGAGSVEIDPWSVPPPADGYENLVLDEGSRPAAGAPPADASEAAAPAPEAEAAPPADRDAVAEPLAAPSRPRSRAILAVAGVAAALVAAAAAWLALGGSRGGARPVRVRVTEELASFAAPPLAPIDPTFVERRRPVAADAPPPVPPPAPRAAASRGRASVPAQVVTLPPAPVPVREVREEPAAATEPAASAPEPAPEKAPAALDASAIPLPPPPVPAPVAARREAAAARGRAPALQTRSCVEDALRVPRGLEDRLPAEVVLTVTVGADGHPGEVSVAGSVDSRLASALASAVRTCRFTPGADASGQPAAAPATMRLRFDP